MLPKEAIEEFKKIYKEDYNIELSDEEALKLAMGFFELMKVVSKPLDGHL